MRDAWSSAIAEDFVDGPHVKFVCDYLQALTEGRIPEGNLIINLPVGCAKSLITTVFWPAWVWTFKPETLWLFTTYSQRLTSNFSEARRALIRSDWYRENWGSTTQLSRDQNSLLLYRNVSRGQMLATSVGGMATGLHPDYVVIDDPLDPRQANSELERESVNAYWDNTLISRGAGRGVRRVLIQQRLHEDDLTGHLLQQGGWFQVALPMRYESDHPFAIKDSPIDVYDWRTEEGELLWPEFWTEERLDKLFMSPHVAAGQLQQRPSAAEGDFFKKSWFQFTDDLPDDLRECEVVRYWDKASTTGDGDWTVGVLMARHSSGTYYVLDMVRGQWDQAPRDLTMLQTAKADDEMWPNYKVVVEQEGGSSGKDMAKILGRMFAGFRYEADRVTGSKITRADGWASQLNAGNVYIKKALWNLDFMNEHLAFPNASHDDIVDSSSGAFNVLTRKGTVDVEGWLKAGCFGRVAV